MSYVQMTPKALLSHSVLQRWLSLEHMIDSWCNARIELARVKSRWLLNQSIEWFCINLVFIA